MKSRLFIMLLCASLSVQCDGAAGTLRQRVAKDAEVKGGTPGTEGVASSGQDGLINKDAAVFIAREDALKAYGSLSKYKVAACEQRDKWLILFEPDDMTQDYLLEYLISKRGGGWVLWKEKISQGRTDIGKRGEDAAGGLAAISAESAISVTQKDADVSSEPPEHFNITACELSQAWFITYEPEGAAMGGGRQYLIDKETGKILYKRFSQ